MLMSFALTVERLACRGMPVPVIMRRLACTGAEVMEALRMMDVPLPDDGPAERRSRPSKETRDAIAEKTPLKWRGHYER